MTIDITMTILSIILMGGNYLFPAALVHEILGVGLFALWGLHIALNRRWYGAIFRGNYNPYRVMQTIINCCILICTIFLMISGIILSNHVLTFLNIQGGLGFARIAHLLASHWYYLFMSLHIGLHVGRLFQNIRAKIIPRIILALVCAYGIYAFIARGVWKYLILQQQFFFFDLDRGYILFAIDYIFIIILFATLSHLLAKSLKKGIL